MSAYGTSRWRVGSAALAVAAVVLGTSWFQSDIRIGSLFADATSRPSRARLSDSEQYQPYRPADRFEFYSRAASAERPVLRGIDDLQAELANNEAMAPRRKAKILNDLAVAHYEAANQGHPKHLIIGLDVAQKAWTLDKTPATAWTRAVLLEALVGAHAASDAWNDYLKLDATSLWADEAQRTPPAVMTPVNRRVAQEEYLSTWARAVLGGRAGDEARALASLRNEGKARELAPGDAFLADTVTWMELLATDHRRKAAAAEAILLRESGGKALAIPHVDEAERRLRDASARLRELHSPLYFDAVIRLATALQMRARPKEATAVLRASEGACAPERRYHFACALHIWNEAILASEGNQESVALRLLGRTLESLERANDSARVAALLFLRAEILDSTRAGDEAWSDRIRAAQLSATQAQRAEFVLPRLAIAATRDGYVYAGESLFALALLQQRQSSDRIAQLARWREYAQSRINGDTSDPNLYFASEGFIVGDSGYLRVSARFESSRRDVVNVAVTGSRVEALPPRTDWSHTIEDLGTEHAQREAVGIMVAETVRKLYERESRAQIENGADDAALWMSDRARRVGVPWKIPACSVDGEATSPAERGRRLAACVPHGVTVVHQDLNTATLHTWVIRNDRVDFTTTGVSSSQLNTEITQLRNAIESNATPILIRTQAQHLYDILLRPVQQKIAGTDLLVYSPSASLRGVPLAALHDGKRFLIETRPLATSPTISAIELPRNVTGSSSALVVLPPAAPSRDELDGARREVREVAGIHKEHATLLTAAAATPDAFLESAPAYDMIHVATHGQTGVLPYQNSIAFGRERIRSYDIFTLNLQRAPIVMLAACRTADSTGGPMNVSLSDAFLAAGASAVVGSLWDVQDEPTEQLSVGFHRALARGATPQDALRAVQMQFIRSHMPISSWAAFQLGL